ncbi:UL16-binding protein 1-like [Bubalus bubalis]|uniref:UL16-binding protein 1-like n=1 Tax=Bubalus bubalis TaxID=89462 RepID=UPI001E1B81E7|nr:UL16-binding protein 1-like [Bubalus bubalis]
MAWIGGFKPGLCFLLLLLFYPFSATPGENGHWTEVHSGGRQMREKWEKDRAVTNFFKKVSMGDCRVWLQDFLVCWEEMLKTTASPNEAPLRVNSLATAIRHITWILPCSSPVSS